MDPDFQGNQSGSKTPVTRYLFVGSSAGVAHAIDGHAHGEELMGAAAPGTHARVVKAAAQLVQQRHRVLVHHVQFCEAPWSFFPTQREYGIIKKQPCQEMKFFFERSLKINSVPGLLTKLLVLLFLEKIKHEDTTCFCKSTSCNSKNIPRTLFKEIVPVLRTHMT